MYRSKKDPLPLAMVKKNGTSDLVKLGADSSDSEASDFDEEICSFFNTLDISTKENEDGSVSVKQQPTEVFSSEVGLSIDPLMFRPKPISRVGSSVGSSFGSSFSRTAFTSINTKSSIEGSARAIASTQEINQANQKIAPIESNNPLMASAIKSNQQTGGLSSRPPIAPERSVVSQKITAASLQESLPPAPLSIPPSLKSAPLRRLRKARKDELSTLGHEEESTFGKRKAENEPIDIRTQKKSTVEALEMNTEELDRGTICVLPVLMPQDELKKIRLKIPPITFVDGASVMLTPLGHSKKK